MEMLGLVGGGSSLSPTASVSSSAVSSLSATKEALQARLSRLQEQGRLLEDLESRLSGLLDTLETLADRLAQPAIRTSPEGFALLAGSAETSWGSHRLEIQQLAQAHVLSSAVFEASGRQLAGRQGTFRISWGGGQGGGEVHVAIPEGVDDAAALESIAGAIRTALPELDASVLRVGSQVRLLVVGPGEGTEALVEEMTDLEGDLLARLELAGSSGPGKPSAATVQEPQDARLVWDGLTLEAPGNVLENFLPGLTLTLQGVTTQPVSVEIGPDVDGFVSELEGFVSAYNELVDALGQSLQAGGDRGERGLLRDSLAVQGFQRTLRETLRGLERDQGLLTQLGLDVERDGRLRLDTEGLRSRLEAGQLSAETVQELFTAWAEALDPYAGATGLLSREEQALERRQTLYEKRLADSSERAAFREQWIVQQMAELQLLLATLQQQQALLAGLGSTSGTTF
jgi:flagellar hook-associated protein 2